MLGLKREPLKEVNVEEISKREKLYQTLDNGSVQFTLIVKPTVAGVCVPDWQMETYEKGWNITPLGKKITDELHSHDGKKKFVFLTTTHSPFPEHDPAFLEFLERYGRKGDEENIQLFTVCCGCYSQIVWISRSASPACVFPKMKGPCLCPPCYDNL